MLITHIIPNQAELNRSYMPFIKNGGLFIQTTEICTPGDTLTVKLLLPGEKEPLLVEGLVVWLTPKYAMHHEFPGVGIQFIGPNAVAVRVTIEGRLDAKMDVGGYAYGLTGEGFDAHDKIKADSREGI